MQVEPPKISEWTADSLLKEFIDLVPYYTKKWNAAHNDFGVALAKLFVNILDDVTWRLNKVPDRNFVAFLNMLDFKLLAPQASSAPVTVEPTDGFNGEVLIPKGTKLAGASDAGQVQFETNSNFYSTTAKILQALYWNKRYDEIYDFAGNYQTKTPFLIFKHTPEKNIQQHVLYLGHPDLFNVRPNSTIVLKLFCEESSLSNLKKLLESSTLTRWEIMTVDPDTSQKKPYLLVPDVQGDPLSSYLQIRLQITEDTPEVKETDVNGVNSRWIRLRLVDPNNIDDDEILQYEIFRFLRLNFSQVSKEDTKYFQKILRDKLSDEGTLSALWSRMKTKSKSDHVIGSDAIDVIHLIKSMQYKILSKNAKIEAINEVAKYQLPDDYEGKLSYINDMVSQIQSEGSAKASILPCLEMPNITMACANVEFSTVESKKDCCKEMENRCCENVVMEDPCANITTPPTLIKDTQLTIRHDMTVNIPANTTITTYRADTPTDAVLRLDEDIKTSLKENFVIDVDSGTSFELTRSVGTYLLEDTPISPPQGATLAIPEGNLVLPKNTPVVIKQGATLALPDRELVLPKNTPVVVREDVFVTPTDNIDIPSETAIDIKQGAIIEMSNSDVILQKDTAIDLKNNTQIRLKDTAVKIVQGTVEKWSGRATLASDVIFQKSGTNITLDKNTKVLTEGNKTIIPKSTKIKVASGFITPTSKFIVVPTSNASIALQNPSVQLNHGSKISPMVESFQLPANISLRLQAKNQFSTQDAVTSLTNRLTLPSETRFTTSKNYTALLKAKQTLPEKIPLVLKNGAIVIPKDTPVSPPQGATLALPDGDLVLPKNTPVVIKQGATLALPDRDIKLPRNTPVMIRGGTTFTIPEGSKITMPENKSLSPPENNSVVVPSGTTISVGGVSCVTPQNIGVVIPKYVGIFIPQNSVLTTLQNTTINTPEDFEAALSDDIRVGLKHISYVLDKNTGSTLPADTPIAPPDVTFPLPQINKITIPKDTPVDIREGTALMLAENTVDIPVQTPVDVKEGTITLPAPVDIPAGTSVDVKNSTLALEPETEIELVGSVPANLPGEIVVSMNKDAILRSNSIPAIPINNFEIQSGDLASTSNSIQITEEIDVILDEDISVDEPSRVETIDRTETLPSSSVLRRVLGAFGIAIDLGTAASRASTVLPAPKSYTIAPAFKFQLPKNTNLTLTNVKGKVENLAAALPANTVLQLSMDTNVNTVNPITTHLTPAVKFKLPKKTKTILKQQVKTRYTDQSLKITSGTNISLQLGNKIKLTNITLQLDKNTESTLPADTPIAPPDVTFPLPQINKITIPKDTPVDIREDATLTLAENLKADIKGKEFDIKKETEINLPESNFNTLQSILAKLPANNKISLAQNTMTIEILTDESGQSEVI